MKTQTNAETETLTIRQDELVLTYSPATDARVVGASDGKLQCRDEQAAEELASEMRAWGVKGANASGCAVVFWA